jgi:tRNA pseudouridine38-40 synthase
MMPMQYYVLDISYKATNYKGWQTQKNNELTIQGMIDECLKKQLKLFKEYKSIGASRTDAGVHAKHQIVKIQISKKIPVKGLKKLLNDHLPNDIRVNTVTICSQDFHPVFMAKNKTYKYYFAAKKDVENIEELQVFTNELIGITHLNLDYEKMKKAARCFEGKHTFKHYFCRGTPIKSLIREITICEINKIQKSPNFIFEEKLDIYELTIAGNGFLKQMVRLIMGTIWNYSDGKIQIKDIKESLKIPDSAKSHTSSEVKLWQSAKKLGPVAPPQGLYLDRIMY